MPIRRWHLLALPVLILAVTLSAAQAAEEHPLVTLIRSKVKDANKPFALLVTIKAKAGKEKDLEAAFAPCVAATKKEAGCLAYELNQDPDNPTVYVMFEKFKSVASLKDHLEQPHTKKLLAALAPLTEGGPMAKVYLVPE